MNLLRVCVCVYDKQTMVTLLEHGANPDTVEPMEKTCLLQWACQKGVLDMADLLIKYKADVNKKDCTRNSPLMMACKNGHLDIVELLLERFVQMHCEEEGEGL